MRTFYDYLLRAHEMGDGDDLSTFLDGFFAAAETFGISCPIDTNDPIARQNWALAMFADASRARVQSQRASASMILERYKAILTLNREAYRGMIFNRRGINADGKDIDYSGEPTDTIYHYDGVVYQNKCTGAFLFPTLYYDLSVEEQQAYIQVRYYEIPGTSSFTIYSSDTAMMAALIYYDVQIEDGGVNQRYLNESRHPGDYLYPYRQVIEDAMAEKIHPYPPMSHSFDKEEEEGEEAP